MIRHLPHNVAPVLSTVQLEIAIRRENDTLAHALNNAGSNRRISHSCVRWNYLNCLARARSIAALHVVA